MGQYAVMYWYMLGEGLKPAFWWAGSVEAAGGVDMVCRTPTVLLLLLYSCTMLPRITVLCKYVYSWLG